MSACYSSGRATHQEVGCGTVYVPAGRGVSWCQLVTLQVELLTRRWGVGQSMFLQAGVSAGYSSGRATHQEVGCRTVYVPADRGVSWLRFR